MVHAPEIKSWTPPKLGVGEPDPMIVKDVYRRSVAYLCIDDMLTGRTPKGTAFAVTVVHKENPHHSQTYFVTARHCIEVEHDVLYLRVNLKGKDDYYDYPVRKTDWYVHEKADVAVIPMRITAARLEDMPNLDTISFTPDIFVNENYHYNGAVDPLPMNPLKDHGGLPVLLGEEVYFLGLFTQSSGRHKNLPIARFGNISRMPEEEIVLKSGGVEFSQLAYLVECKSWGGHSGSPVFWLTSAVVSGPMPPFPHGLAQGFLGLVSAHYDIGSPVLDSKKNQAVKDIAASVNAGIAVVTPAHFVKELLMRDDVVQERDDLHKKASKFQPRPTMDFDVTEPDTFSRDDFFGALGKASAPLPDQPDEES